MKSDNTCYFNEWRALGREWFCKKLEVWF